MSEFNKTTMIMAACFLLCPLFCAEWSPTGIVMGASSGVPHHPLPPAVGIATGHGRWGRTGPSTPAMQTPVMT